MTESKLVGYVRKAIGSRVINITLEKKTLNECKTYKTHDGREMVRLDVNLDKIVEVIYNEREVTSVVQVEGGE